MVSARSSILTTRGGQNLLRRGNLVRQVLLDVFSSAVRKSSMWNEEQSAYRIHVILFLAKSGLPLSVGVVVECP